MALEVIARGAKNERGVGMPVAGGNAPDAVGDGILLIGSVSLIV